MTTFQIAEIARAVDARQKHRGVESGVTLRDLEEDLREVFNLHIVMAFTREDVKSFALELGYTLTEHNLTECVQDFMPSTAPIGDIKNRLRAHITRLGKRIEPANGTRPPDFREENRQRDSI